MQSPAGLAVRGSNVVLVDRELDAVVEVDSAGNRTILSRAGSRGTGEAFDNPDADLTPPELLSVTQVTESPYFPGEEAIFEYEAEEDGARLALPLLAGHVIGVARGSGELAGPRFVGR